MEKNDSILIHRHFSDLEKVIPLYNEFEHGNMEEITLKRIENLTQRLESCSSVYTLGIQTQNIRDKSRKEKLSNINSKIIKLKQEINKKDLICHSTIVNLHKIVRNEIKEYIRTSNSIEFREYIKANEEKFNQIQKTVQTNVEIYQKKFEILSSIIKDCNFDDQEITDLCDQIQRNNFKLKQIFNNRFSN